MLNPVVEAQASPLLAELATGMVRVTIFAAESKPFMLLWGYRQHLAHSSTFSMLMPSVSVLEIVLLANEMLSKLTFPTVCCTLVSPTPQTMTRSFLPSKYCSGGTFVQQLFNCYHHAHKDGTPTLATKILSRNDRSGM